MNRKYRPHIIVAHVVCGALAVGLAATGHEVLAGAIIATVHAVGMFTIAQCQGQGYGN